jgi:hypothetical protein
MEATKEGTFCVPKLPQMNMGLRRFPSSNQRLSKGRPGDLRRVETGF